MENEGNKGFNFTLEENKNVYDLGSRDFGDRIFTFRLEIDKDVVTLFGKGIPKEIGKKEVDMRYRGKIKKGKKVEMKLEINQKKL